MLKKYKRKEEQLMKDLCIFGRLIVLIAFPIGLLFLLFNLFIGFLIIITSIVVWNICGHYLAKERSLEAQNIKMEERQLKQENILTNRRKSISSSKIDNMQRFSTNNDCSKKIYNKYYSDYSEKPYISQDRKILSTVKRNPSSHPSKDMVDNNLNGKFYESIKDIDTAIALYEYNIHHRFEGNYPYDRLSIIYRKRKGYRKEINVLETAIDVFTQDVPRSRSDRAKKLSKFKERLKKAKELADKTI